MPSQFTARRWMRNKGPLVESRPAGWSFARFPRTEEGRKGFPPSPPSPGWAGGRGQAHQRDSLRFRGAPPRRRAPTRRNAHDPRSAEAGRPTGRGRGGLLAMRDQFSRILFHRRGSGCGSTHAHTYTHAHTCAQSGCVRRNSRPVSARFTERALDSTERDALVKSHRSRASTPTPVRDSVDFFLLFFFFFPLMSRENRSLADAKGCSRLSSKILEMRNSPWPSLETEDPPRTNYENSY